MIKSWVCNRPLRFTTFQHPVFDSHQSFLRAALSQEVQHYSTCEGVHLSTGSPAYLLCEKSPYQCPGELGFNPSQTCICVFDRGH